MEKSRDSGENIDDIKSEYFSLSLSLRFVCQFVVREFIVSRRKRERNFTENGDSGILCLTMADKGGWQ